MNANACHKIVYDCRRVPQEPAVPESVSFSQSEFLNVQFATKIPNKRQGNPPKCFPGVCALSLLSGRGVKFGFLA